MQVFVYEFVTGGGFLGEASGERPPESLLCEGTAMLAALADDFAALDEVEVATLQDGRWGDFESPGVLVRPVHSVDEEAHAFDELAASADWTAVIAPEISGSLLERCRRVETAGGRLLGPEPAVVELASDKHITAEHLARAGIPAPEGRPLEPGEPLPADFPYPAVLKPRLGAGSLLVERIGGAEALAEVAFPCRLERFCPGLAVSAAMLCGPAEQVALPPCEQRLSQDGRFTYQGGRLPLCDHLADRATELARRAVESLPQPTGYLGVDLVLGDHRDGRDDRVIEINPRLTTSYVGLRAAAEGGVNLAGAMLAVREGRRTTLAFRSGRIQFEPDGTIAR
jgi:predicted ATP-grasp superfamily ATP-dependent carboligase